MTAYRDQYASVFRGGRGVTLIGISPDTPEALGSWMKDADFPFLFAQDVDGSVVEAFGGKIRDNGMTIERAVVVIDPEGKIHKWIPQFQQIDPTAYVELQALIAEVAPDLEEGEEFDTDGLEEALQAMEAGVCE